MEPFKSPVSRLARLFQKSRDAWKEKALEKQQRLRAAQIRIRDLEKSRAYWKERAMAAERGEPRGQPPPGEGGDGVADAEEPPPAALMLARPSHHRFSLFAIELTLRLYLVAGLGSRGVPRLLQWLAPWLPLGVPAHTTVLNWVYRCGLARLQETPPQRTDWIYIVDHTLTLGAAKCLLILGISVERLRHSGFSPSHEAMTVLALEVTTHSTGVWVAGVLQATAQRTGSPVQIVSDDGSDLRKGIRLFQEQYAESCVATYDISHRIANQLKAQLRHDARLTALLAQGRATRTRVQQTDLAFLSPPGQRTKARTMHLDLQIAWAQRTLAFHDAGDFGAIGRPYVFNARAWVHLRGCVGTLRMRPLTALIGLRETDRAAFSQTLLAHSDLTPEDLDERFWHLVDTGRARFLEHFGWLLAYRQDLSEYDQLIAQSKSIQTVLKTQGLFAGVRPVLEAALPPLATRPPRVAAFTTRLLEAIEHDAAKVPAGQTWLASSDIIESVFGHYKNLAERAPLKEIGKLILTIPARLTQWSSARIRESLERVRSVDVDHWVKTHLGDSMLARRRRALRPLKTGTETA